MIVNLGLIDCKARFAIGLALIAAAVPVGFTATGWNWLGWIGVALLATAVLGLWPLYSLIGPSAYSAKRT